MNSLYSLIVCSMRIPPPQRLSLRMEHFGKSHSWNKHESVKSLGPTLRDAKGQVALKARNRPFPIRTPPVCENNSLMVVFWSNCDYATAGSYIEIGNSASLLCLTHSSSAARGLNIRQRVRISQVQNWLAFPKREMGD